MDCGFSCFQFSQSPIRSPQSEIVTLHRVCAYVGGQASVGVRVWSPYVHASDRGSWIAPFLEKGDGDVRHSDDASVHVQSLCDGADGSAFRKTTAPKRKQ